MSNFKWTEIKNWAKNNNLEPKKIKEGGYVWKDKNYPDIDSLVKDLWNEVSKNKWVEYQDGLNNK